MTSDASNDQHWKQTKEEQFQQTPAMYFNNFHTTTETSSLPSPASFDMTSHTEYDEFLAYDSNSQTQERISVPFLPDVNSS